MKTHDAKQLWNDVCAGYLKNQLGQFDYNVAFSDVEPYFVDEKTFGLSTRNETAREFAAHHEELVQAALQAVSHRRYDVLIQVGKKVNKKPKNGRSAPSRWLNPEFTFDNFIVGDGNQLAYTASLMVAKQTSKRFAPLYLYGGSGLGKTHLLHAIGNQVQETHPELTVVYVQMEQFVNEYIACITKNSYEDFRGLYRNADLLMIDDIQFLEGKERMQEEFFHTFNAVHLSGKYVVLTCDKPPKSLTQLDERMRTRFSGGYTIDIKPPDYETRLAILRRLSEYHGYPIPNDVANYLAKHITSNVRELSGAFKTLTMYTEIGPAITLETAERLLKSILSPGAVKTIDSTLIMEVVSSYFGVTVNDLISKRRSQDIVIPRQIAMYLCRTKTTMTLSDIGRVFGNRNHATVLHAYDKIKQDSEVNVKLQADIMKIEQRLTN
jgi:chromosomal replication initiator protein